MKVYTDGILLVPMILGAFMLVSPSAHAKEWPPFTGAEIAECNARHPDMVCTLGRGSPYGTPGCSCSGVDRNWTPEKQRARDEMYRKQEEEYVRKGGKPDPNSGIKKTPQPTVAIPDTTPKFDRM